MRRITADKVYLRLLGLLLLGYAFFGKSFAYISVGPVYIGEVLLGLGAATFVSRPQNLRVFRSPVSWSLLAFALWGAVNTIPYLGEHGMLALRDAALWGYGVFTLTVAAALLNTRLIGSALSWYAGCVPWLMLWLPASFIGSLLLKDLLPLGPDGRMPLLTLKSGDIAVHVAGASVFLAIGLVRRHSSRRRSESGLREWGWWALIALAFLATGARNRGGLLAMLGAGIVLMLLRPANRFPRLALVAILAFTLIVTLDLSIPLSPNREMSPVQILANLESIFMPSRHVELSGTVEWRLDWWRTILNYTLFGDRFWTGKGYGINLADSDGFQVVHEGSPLRSPHSSHFTILARSGLPGLASWALFQGCVFLVLFKGYVRATRAQHRTLADLHVWLIAYLAAFVINSSFDVYLEGPQGGIWFWSLIGLIVAVSFLRPKAHRRGSHVQREYRAPAASTQ